MIATRNSIRTFIAGFLALGIFSGCVKPNPVTYTISSGTKPKEEVSKPESEDKKPDVLKHLAIEPIDLSGLVRDTPKSRRIIRCEGEDKNLHPHPESVIVFDAFYEKAVFEIELDYGHVGSISVARLNSRELNEGRDFFLFYETGTNQNPKNHDHWYVSQLTFSTDPKFPVVAQTVIRIQFGMDGRPTNLSATHPLHTRYEVSTSDRLEQLQLTCEALPALERVAMPEFSVPIPKEWLL